MAARRRRRHRTYRATTELGRGARFIGAMALGSLAPLKYRNSAFVAFYRIWAILYVYVEGIFEPIFVIFHGKKSAHRASASPSLRCAPLSLVCALCVSHFVASAQCTAEVQARAPRVFGQLQYAAKDPSLYIGCHDIRISHTLSWKETSRVYRTVVS